MNDDGEILFPVLRLRNAAVPRRTAAPRQASYMRMPAYGPPCEHATILRVGYAGAPVAAG